MLFHRNSAQNRCPLLTGLLVPVLILLFSPFSALTATLGQLVPKPGTTAPPETEKSQLAQPAPNAAPAVEPVPVSEVAKRLEASRRLLKEISERPEASDLAEIAKEVDATRTSFAEEAKNAATTIAKAVRPEDIWDIEVAWKNRAARIARAELIVSNQAAQLYKDFTAVEQEQQIWELTLKSYAAGALPRQVESAIRAFLADAQKTKAEVRKRLDAALILENQLYQRETTISELLSDINQARERFRGSLMVAERVPLWRIAVEWERMELPAGGITGLLSRQLADGVEFVQTHPFGLGLFIFFFFIVLVVASLLSRKVAQWTQDHPSFSEATHFLKRPMSLALLITLVPFLIFFTANTPRLISAVAALLLLVPVLRLLPPLVHPAARPSLFVLAGFYFLDIVRNLLLPIPLLSRLSFVFSDIVAIAVVAWLFRSARIRNSHLDNPIPPSLVLAGRIVLILLSASLLANILGYVDLASLISTGTLYSAYAAFTLFGTARALSILFEVFLDTDMARSLSVVRRYGKTISWRTSSVLKFAAFLLWVDVSLGFFSVRDAVLAAVVSFFTAPIMEGRVNFSLWDIIAFGLVLSAAIMISRWVRILLEEDVFPRTRLARGIPVMITTTVYYSILLFGFFLALGIAGVDLNRFTLLAGAFGVGVGFGLQNIVNNFISGLILLFERPIHPGDTVEVSGLSGVVKSIGIRSSTIATGDGADAIIPNATLISEKLMNWTLTNPWRRVDIRIAVAYGSDLEKVMQILLSVAAADPDVLREPAPAVVFQGFGDSVLNFEMRVWAPVQANLDTKSRLSIAVVQALREAGIEIPVPQRDLNLRSVNKEIKELLSHGAPGLRKPE
jgi:potassium-dependent mechanosensitive channel